MIQTNKSHSDHLLDALVYGTSIQKVTPMACDIHWYSETKKDGVWICDQAETLQVLHEEDDYPDMDNFPGRDRDYWWFGFIQPGVRSEFDFSFDERVAIPEDLSKEVQLIFDRWSSDGHSHGWLTREEMKAKLEEMKVARAQALIQPTRNVEPIVHLYNRLEKVIADLESDVPDSDRRVVFCFDN